MFLPVPLPERFSKVVLGMSAAESPMFSVGLQVITETTDGLKIVPTKAVVFAFGTGENPEERVFDISPKWARDMAQRLVEFAAAAETP